MGATRALAVVAVTAAIAACGCGRHEAPSAPVACKEGPASIRSALASAPGAVRLEDGTRLSSCFARGADAGEVEIVGSGMLSVAQDLAVDARRRPRGPSPGRLGYLIGAARRGADGTNGIHDELVRRLEQEAAGMDASSPSFRAGERAGRESG